MDTVYSCEFVVLMWRHIKDIPDSKKFEDLISYIDAWGAQQREEGRRELRAVVEYEQRHAAESEVALAAEHERAKKAEARAAQLSSDLLANAKDAKDAERLDFVVNNSSDIGFSSNPAGEWFVLDKKTLYPILKSTFSSARDAIDAAIAAKAVGNTP